MKLNGIDYGDMPEWLEGNELASKLFASMRVYHAESCEAEHEGSDSYATRMRGIVQGIGVALWEMSKLNGHWYTPLSFESYARELNHKAKEEGHEGIVTPDGTASLKYC